LPTIGYLHALSREINRDFLNAFRAVSPAADLSRKRTSRSKIALLRHILIDYQNWLTSLLPSL
jgi:hypothetical protein